MKPLLLLVAVAVLSSFAAADGPKSAVTTETETLAPVQGRCYELRTYKTHPGKLDALHARFRNHTNKLLEKHGMKLIGFWVPQDADHGAADTLIYIVEHPTRKAAKIAWSSFGKDPAWIAARTESEKDGPIVIRVDSVFLNPTDYSELK